MSLNGLDSATVPTLAQAKTAHQEGYGAWVGYLPPSPGWHSAVWPNSAFDAVRQAGMLTAGVIFGPDATHAVSVARAAGLGLVIVDVESNDAGHYASSWGDMVRASGLRAGCYGLRGTIAKYASHFDVMWYAAENWDGVSNHGAQWGYDRVIAGVSVDVNTFGNTFFVPPPTPPPDPPAPLPQEASVFYLDPNDNGNLWRAFVDQDGHPFARQWANEAALVRLVADSQIDTVLLHTICVWVTPDGTTLATGEGLDGHWWIGSRAKGSYWAWEQTPDLIPAGSFIP